MPALCLIDGISGVLAQPDRLGDTIADVLTDPGITWTPTTAATDPKDRHDRIDFVFWGRNGCTSGHINAAQIVGESKQHADIVVNDYPSDHRAVVAEIEFSAKHSHSGE